MNFEHRRIVDAVLYKSYMLFPYRPYSIKSRQRCTFGGIYPQAYSEAQGSADPCRMQRNAAGKGMPGNS